MLYHLTALQIGLLIYQPMSQVTSFVRSLKSQRQLAGRGSLIGERCYAGLGTVCSVDSLALGKAAQA